MTHNEQMPVPSIGEPKRPRAVDHAVLPVESLETARARLAAIGFTVAPEAQHPFGTENCCVFLADGAYLEPLAVAQRETCEDAARQGNVFVARDQAWRFRNGGEGFSALSLTSDDAEADHADFRAAGMSGGRMLKFSRPSRTAGGETGLAEFRLAFAADLRSPDSFLFTCQRINAPAGSRGALSVHANGVTGLAAAVASETNPSDFQYLLQDVLRQRDLRAHSFGMDIATANARVSVLTDEGMLVRYGVASHGSERGLRFRLLHFSCANQPELRRLLDDNGVAWREHAGLTIVDPAPGQGATFAFGEYE